MTIYEKCYMATYTGKSFSVDGCKLFPLQCPLSFLLGMDKVEDTKTQFSEAVINALNEQLETEDVDLWLTEAGEVVTIMSNAANTRVKKLKPKYCAEVLSHNGIYWED